MLKSKEQLLTGYLRPVEQYVTCTAQTDRTSESKHFHFCHAAGVSAWQQFIFLIIPKTNYGLTFLRFFLFSRPVNPLIGFQRSELCQGLLYLIFCWRESRYEFSVRQDKMSVITCTHHMFLNSCQKAILQWPDIYLFKKSWKEWYAGFHNRYSLSRNLHQVHRVIVSISLKARAVFCTSLKSFNHFPNIFWGFSKKHNLEHKQKLITISAYREKTFLTVTVCVLLRLMFHLFTA